MNATINSSALALGSVWHQRLSPISHSFSYAMAYVYTDLDKVLPRKGLLRVRAMDYLDGGSGSLRARLLPWLAKAGVSLPVGSIRLLTLPRFLGFGFNPVSFYFVFHKQDAERLVAFVAEINNTFGERHLYVIPESDMNLDEQGWYHSERPKAFHVSPFNSVEGEYRFAFKHTEGLRIRIDIHKDGEVFFKSGLELDRQVAFDTWQTTKVLCTMPLAWTGTVVRIMLHAAKMYFWRGMRAVPKPASLSPWTIYHGKAVFLQRLFASSAMATFYGKFQNRKPIVNQGTIP